MEPLRILFLAPYVPSPVRVRPYNLIRALSAKGHEVTVVAVCASERERADATALRSHCTRVETVRVPLARSLWNCAWGLGKRVPLQVLYSYSPALERRLAAEVGDPSRRYDVLHIEHLRAVLCGLKMTGLPRVYDSVDCISLLLEKTQRLGATSAIRLKALADLERTRRFEGSLLRRFERVVISSAHDKAAFAALGRGDNGADSSRPPDPLSVLPNGVDLEYFSPNAAARQPATLVYVGRMSYHANVAAVRVMVRSVLPRIWAQRPEVTLHIVGQDPPREVKALARGSGGRVSVSGTVPDVRPYVGRATVSVSPLCYAVGSPNKILESMAMGTPVVTTPVGVAALGVRHDEHLLVGQDPADFAAQVLRLLADPHLRHRLCDAGRRYVERHHDWKAIVDRLEDIYYDVITRFRAPSQVRA